MELKHTQHLEGTYNGQNIVREIYTIGAYTVTVDVTKYLADNTTHRSISVACPFDNWSDETRYVPEINYRDGYWDHKEPRFAIQTTSYGSLEADEYVKFLEAQQEALEVVKVLNRELLGKQ